MKKTFLILLPLFLLGSECGRDDGANPNPAATNPEASATGGRSAIQATPGAFTSQDLRLLDQVAGVYTGAVDTEYTLLTLWSDLTPVKIFLNHSGDDTNKQAIVRVEKANDSTQHFCTLFRSLDQKETDGSQTDLVTTLEFTSGNVREHKGQVDDAENVIQMTLKTTRYPGNEGGEERIETVLEELAIDDSAVADNDQEVEELIKVNEALPSFDELKTGCGFSAAEAQSAEEDDEEES